MKNDLEYIVDDKYNKLFKKVSVLTGIQKGLKEVADARKSGKQLLTLKDFLNPSEKKPKRILGLLEGKGKVAFATDFKITEEEFLGS